MLIKKLFIGLIILSALTAEGTAFFNTALAPFNKYITDLYSEEDENDLKTDLPADVTMVSPVRYGIYSFIPVDEIIGIRDGRNVSFCFPYTFSSLFYRVVTCQAQLSCNRIQNSLIVLSASDISPPARG